MNYKKKIVVTIVVILAAAAVWKLHRYYQQPAEPAYTVADIPQRVLLTFGDEDCLSRNVSWMCDTILHDSHLELRSLQDSMVTILPAIGEIFQSRSGKAAYYHAKMRNLKPNHEYSYRVSTNHKCSDWYDFSTAIYNDSVQKEFSFIYFGDIQGIYGDYAKPMVDQAISHFPESKFVICAGDLTERPIHEYWEQTFLAIDTFAHRIPLINATGNHNYLKEIPLKLERRFALTFTYYLDSMLDDNHVYRLNYANADFFVLDSTRETPFLLQQFHWLKQQLELSNARWKIVVLHHPIYSARTNHVLLRGVLNPILIEHGVDLVLQGHEHVYARRVTHENGIATTPVYVISHCSPKNYAMKHPDRFDLYETEDQYYQHIIVSPDTIKYAAYKIDSSRPIDSLIIHKD